MKRLFLILSALVVSMLCYHAKAQVIYVEAKFGQDMSSTPAIDSLDIKDSLGLKERFIVFRSSYVKLSKSDHTELDIAYDEIWDEEQHIDSLHPKSNSKLANYTFCKVGKSPRLFKWSRDTKNGQFFVSPLTISADTCSNWTFYTIRKRSDDKPKVLTADSTFVQGDSIVSIAFRTGVYSLVDSVIIGENRYPVIGKDRFMEGRNLTIPCHLMLLNDQPLPVRYVFRQLENGQLISSTKEVTILDITKRKEDIGCWFLWLIIPAGILIIVFFRRNKKKAKTNQENSDTSQQTTAETDTLTANAPNGDSASGTKEQSTDADHQASEGGSTNTNIEAPSDNHGSPSIKGNEKIKLLSDFADKLKSGSLVEPNSDIRDLIVDCREALLKEGGNKSRLEFAECIKKSPVNSKYQLTANFSSPSEISTYLENLVSIVKAEAEKSHIAELGELKMHLETVENNNKDLISKNKELGTEKETVEQQLKDERETNASLQEEISGLTTQVQELSNAKPEKVTFTSLESSDQEQIKEQVKQEISKEYQQTIDAKQTEINNAQESIKNLNTLIGELNAQLSTEKDGREKEREAHSDALKQLNEKHILEVDELNTRHQEAINQQKSLHEAQKTKWRDREEELKAEIKKGEDTLKEKLLAAEETQKRAVLDAIAETEAAAKQILDEEINARNEEKAQSERYIQKLNEDNHREKEAIQKRMQQLLDEEINARNEEKAQNERYIQKLNEDNHKEKEAIQKRIQHLLDKAISDRDEVVNDRKGERQMLAYEMQQHIAHVYQQLTIAFNSAVGNFRTEGAELVKEAESMYNWYQSAVVSPFQAENSLTQSEIIEIVQSQLIKQVQDKYSLVSRLTRIASYSQISSLWIEWMSKQGVNVITLRMAYNEMCALMGRCKITLIVPSLFSDVYSKNDIYTLNMSFAPIVNFCPADFDHLKNSGTTVVRDLSHPGYAIDGQIKVGPEVLAQ